MMDDLCLICWEVDVVEGVVVGKSGVYVFLLFKFCCFCVDLIDFVGEDEVGCLLNDCL